MTVMEMSPELDVRSGDQAELIVDPTDISFHDLPGDVVMIRVKIRNEGGHRSRPTFVRLESAPLGAFVPWQPLAILPVPAMEPGESRELSTKAVRPRPTPLGNFDRVPPRRLLTAINAPDEQSPQPAAGVAATLVLNLLGRRANARSAGGSVVKQRSLLSPDLMELLGRGQPYWAGNINVFVGQHAVERHLAKALRIYPGRANLAMFVVGGPGRPDAYAFEIAGANPEWKAALHDVTHGKTLLAGSSSGPIRETQWVQTNGQLLIMLVTRPPVGCEEGNLAVHATRQSCQRTAVVEFNLDPAAQGTGCYVV